MPAEDGDIILATMDKVYSKEETYSKEECLDSSVTELLGDCTSPHIALTRLATRPNPNLLDNWYFGNPVNQRGQTEYTGTSGMYAIDRWCLQEAELSMKVDTGCITLTGSGEKKTYALQRFDWIADITGKTVTISLLLSDGTLYSGTSIVRTTESSEPVVDSVFISGKCSFYIHKYANELAAFVIGMNQGASLSILAAKLELGPVQTLAHKEGDAWVLNEIPSYATELAKCQRYFLVLPGTTVGTGWAQVGMGIGHTDTDAICIVPVPVTMRAKPAITSEGVWHLCTVTDWSKGINCTSISLNQFSDNVISVYANADSGIVPGTAYHLVCVNDNPNKLIINANL